MKKLRTILACRYFGVAVILGLSVLVMSSKTDKTPTEKGQTIVSTTTNYKPEENYQETLLNLNLDMVYVQGGTFKMGATGRYVRPNEKPVHKVTLSSYHISRCEITQAQWKAVMGTTIQQQRDKVDPSIELDSLDYLNGVGDNYPMYYVSWNEAKEFCEKLSEKTGKKYALPTEAQWEFAARGGVKSKGYKYSGSNTPDDVAWYYVNSGEQTHTVGTKVPNELGICDMSGNVWEMCADGYDFYSSEAVTNPVGFSSEGDHVIRGGSWASFDFLCRVSFRMGGVFPGYFDGSLGFRVICLP